MVNYGLSIFIFFLISPPQLTLGVGLIRYYLPKICTFTRKLGLKPRPSRATLLVVDFISINMLSYCWFNSQIMKARFKYRIYPTPGQKYRLAKLFGCVRIVWNDSLAYCQ